MTRHINTLQYSTE